MSVDGEYPGDDAIIAADKLALIDTTWFWVVGVAGGVVALFGVVGNGLSVAVWGSKELRSSPSNIFYLCLALYDLLDSALYLMQVSLFEVIKRFEDSREPMFRFFDPAAVVTIPLLCITSAGSVYTTLALTVDRCLAISRPLTWPLVCNLKWTYVVQVVILLWSVAVSIPVALEGKWEWYDVSNTSYVLYTSTEYSESYFQVHIFLVYIYPAVTFAVPVLGILVTNVVLVVKVHSGRQAASSMSNSTAQQKARLRDTNRMTMQVLFISLLTLLSRCLYATDYIWMAVTQSYFIDDCSIPCAIVSAISKLVVAINASVNIVLYLTFARKFRSHFFKRFPCLVTCCGARAQPQLDSVFSIRSRSTKMTNTISNKSHSTSVAGSVQNAVAHKPQNLPENQR